MTGWYKDYCSHCIHRNYGIPHNCHHMRGNLRLQQLTYVHVLELYI
ncbi:hypothetical protein [Aeromonas caviae]|nr:hypothetical protein [Aeromonas caviae]WGY77170.1 hypothetical protein MLL77_09065 [Aeromonas caviae]